MSRPRALIVGWGSIGKQHAASLHELGYDCAIVSKHENTLPRFDTISDALEIFDPEYAVVATPTAEHLNTVSQLARAQFRGRVLVEKPLFDRIESFPEHNFSTIGVGYQLRFHPVLMYLKEQLTDQRILSCHCYVGQYLPDWRPNSDYRRSYSASRAKGGGVLRDLSHELDYLLWIFGTVGIIKAVGGKFSTLKIDSEDTVGLTCSFDRCPVATIQLNYCDRIGRRELVVTTDRATYVADLRNYTLATSSEAARSFRLEPLLNRLHQSLSESAPQHFCTLEEAMAVLTFINEVDKQLYCGSGK
jgi:predicted dehydrogenase